MAYSKEQLHERYLKGYITDEQLQKYVDLQIISQEEYDEWYAEKHPTEVTYEAE